MPTELIFRVFALSHFRDKKSPMLNAPGFRFILPASSAASATTAAVTTATTAATTLGLGSCFINSEGPAADFFAVDGIDSSLHILLRNLDEAEALVADDSNFNDRAVRLEQIANLALRGRVGHIAYIK
jgi:hypothetical protein